MPQNKSFLDKPDFGSLSRQRIIKVIVLLVASLFIYRLAYLQLIRGSAYRTESVAQAIKEDVIEPFRGNMYDRNNDLVVHNEPSFTVTLTLNDFYRDRLGLLASILQIDTNEIIKTLERNKHSSPFQGIKIARDVDFQTVSLIEEYSEMLPGIDVIVESKRLYNFTGNFSHFLGYTREISQGQLEKMGYFKQGDVIGQAGLESTYDNVLRGKKGINYVAVTRSGEKISRFNKGFNDIPVNNGHDLYLTIDKKLQEKGEELMQGKRGAIVAIDPSNGEVLCLVSKPDYDPREFSGKVPADIYKKLSEDPAKPLYNRALQSIYPPGSTWKMLVAIAGLSEGIINENSTIPCGGSFAFGNRSYACHGAHGSTNVRKAIQASCNVFFYQLALKLGHEKLTKYAKMFGFGERTMIDLSHEGTGLFPTAEWLRKRYGKWVPKGNLVNYGIGQGEIGVTPLQMAVYCATIANGGIVYQPHLVRAVNNNELHRMLKNDYGSKNLNLNPRVINIVKEGMYAVVNTPGGTAGNAQIPGIKVAGKTGTAQNPQGQDHSWFICFAPYENPKIAVCCMVENAGFGATVAAPIARDIVSFYLNKPLANQNALIKADSIKKADSLKIKAIINQAKKTDNKKQNR